MAKRKQDRNNNGNIHPRRIFQSPNEMETAWNEYKEHLKEEAKEWVRVLYVGKNGERKEDPQKLPYTIEGFKRFCRNNYGDIAAYFKNTEGYYDDFLPICNFIKEEIRENQITGGLLGMYNASITQRLNNLKEQTENETTHKVENITGMTINKE